MGAPQKICHSFWTFPGALMDDFLDDILMNLDDLGGLETTWNDLRQLGMTLRLMGMTLRGSMDCRRTFGAQKASPSILLLDVRQQTNDPDRPSRVQVKGTASGPSPVGPGKLPRVNPPPPSFYMPTLSEPSASYNQGRTSDCGETYKATGP